MIHSPGSLTNREHHVVNLSINTKLASCFETCHNHWAVTPSNVYTLVKEREQIQSVCSRVVATSSAFGIPFKIVLASCVLSFPSCGYAQVSGRWRTTQKRCSADNGTPNPEKLEQFFNDCAVANHRVEYRPQSLDAPRESYQMQVINSEHDKKKDNPAQ